MFIQADMFIAEYADESPANVPTDAQAAGFVLLPPSMRPVGAEGVERRNARLREVEARNSDKRKVIK